MPEVKFDLIADTSKLTAGLRRAEKEINNLTQEQDRLNKEFLEGKITEEQYAKSLRKLGGQMRSYKNAVDALSGSKGKLGKQTGGNATPALQEFSRTIQDAPYGIQGVANNIQQLTANFGNLAKSSGGSVNALKAMVGALAGPAGVLLAVSAVTSLWVTYEDEIKDAISSTGQLQSAFREASEEIGEEISQLTVLVDAYKDSNTSAEDKKVILGELSKQYPKYFGDLDNEKTKVGDVTKAYDLQKQAIIGLGIEKALEAKKAPLYAKLAELEIKSNADLLTSLQRLTVYDGSLDSSQRVKVIKKFGEENRKAQREEIDKEIAEINKGIKRVRDRFGTSSGDAAGITGKKPTDEELAERAQALTGLPKPSYLQTFGKQTKDALARIAESYGLAFDEITLIGSLPTGIPTPEEIAKDQEEYLKHLNFVKNQVAGFKEDLNSILSVENIGGALGSIGESIGAALAEGGSVLGAAGQALIQQFSGFLSDMGDLLIKYGLLAVAKGKLDLAIASGGPLSIGAGLAAVAIGIALKAAGAAIGARSEGGFAGGGGGGRGRSTGAPASPGGFGGGSSVSGGPATGGSGKVVFEIAGYKLVGVLRNELNRNKALGGSNLSI